MTALAFGTNAFAGNFEIPDFADAAPDTANATDWGGFYIGGIASFDYGTTQQLADGVPYASADLEGSMYGGFVGFNIQRGSIVFGVEAAYSDGAIALSPGVFELTDVIDVKGRVGFATGPVFVYAVAGASSGIWLHSTDGPAPVTGVAYGAGIEYLVAPRIFIGAEYLLRDLVGDYGGAFPGFSTAAHTQSIQIRAGLKF